MVAGSNPARGATKTPAHDASVCHHGRGERAEEARELQEGVRLGAAMGRFDGHQKLFD